MGVNIEVMPQFSFDTPLGAITLTEEDEKIVSLDWGDSPLSVSNNSLLKEGQKQIQAYFAGKLKIFSLPLAPLGTEFQKKAWLLMQEIPYAQTISYAELAVRLSTAPRAAGMACARNNIPIVIPCHRILGSKGALGGYSGFEGIESKKYLLNLERHFQEK